MNKGDFLAVDLAARNIRDRLATRPRSNPDDEVKRLGAITSDALTILEMAYNAPINASQPLDLTKAQICALMTDFERIEALTMALKGKLAELTIAAAEQGAFQ